ncbi:hypothetical protein NCC78_17995 [Micromonospora phytophila]|uniref:hypothetical protein n=1 Tax=Micromonospora phytophila TaxID=709888 RepID=UPI0020301AB9|nr:hypothetical protein [Micromonospora phytophila]MCM0676563.1 hypothetical protein [Micromonospora phytophila]
MTLTLGPAMQSGVAFDVSLAALHRGGRVEVGGVLPHLQAITPDARRSSDLRDGGEFRD